MDRYYLASKNVGILVSAMLMLGMFFGAYNVEISAADTPPTGSIIINTGATYTNTSSVTLTLSASDADGDLSLMRFLNHGNQWSDWEPYGTSKAWTLSSGQGTRTVYVEYQDSAGNVSQTYSDDIVVDRNEPDGSIVINGGAAYTGTTSVTLTLSASDSRSGVSQMRFSSDGTNWSDWEIYGTSRAWTLLSGEGTKTVYVQYQDNAGNISSSYTDTIVLDTTSPSPPGELRVTSCSLGTIDLYWSSNLEPDLGGYKVYYGIVPGVYGPPVNVGNVTTYSLSDLLQGQIYYVVIASYDMSGHESGYSNELSARAGVTNTPLTDTTEFVYQQYRDFLNREAEPEGLQYWVYEIDSGGMTKPQVIDSFLWSQEFGERIAPIVRLYSAYFLRIPDYEGLQYWISEYINGRPFELISDYFAASPEFFQTYGSLTNEQFVTLVYQNVLRRNPDPEGQAYWTGQLDSAIMTRGQVMIGFSESPEYQELMENGVFVTMTYVGMLRRSPDQGGYYYWFGYLESGNSGLALIDGFLNSQEYAYRFNCN